MEFGGDAALLGRLLALLAVLLAGAGLRSVGALNERRADVMNDAAYYVALPALVFVATYDRSIQDLLSSVLLAGLLVVLFTTAGLAWLVHRRRSSGPRRSVAIVQSYHSNLGYLGLPLVAATFDAEVTAIASVILGVFGLVQLPLTVFVLTTVNDAETSIRREMGRLAKNPPLVALAAGVAVGAIGIGVPAPVAAGLDWVSALALPLALLCVGSSLHVDVPAIDPGATGSVLALKMACMPAIAWAVFSALAVDSATFTASVVMLGMPTAVSTFVFAHELGGDEEFASLNVFLTTVVSVVSLFVLIALLR